MRILLVVYDNGSYIHYFPQSLSYIAAVLLKAGHDVEIYNQDKCHYPDEHLTWYLDREKFDCIGLSVVGGYYQYRKLLKISEAVCKAKNKPFYIIGGHGPSPEPEYFLRKTNADAVVMGEGEETVVELVDAVGNKRPLSPVKGVAFREGKKVVINERRPLIKDIDSIPFPAFHLFPVYYYSLLRMPHAGSSDFLMSAMTGRGCTYTCTFCYRMDEGFRPRSPENIVDEIRLLKREYGITYIEFCDELVMSSAERTMRLCEEFLKAELNMKWWANGRLNYARPDVLKIMKRAGCVFLNYGIESMDDQVLKNMNKDLTTDQIVSGVEATIKAGISPGLNIIFGNIGDDKETLKKGVNFLLKYDDCTQVRTIRPVTPYPGSQLYYDAIRKGFLKDVEDFYERKHLNSDLLSVNFTDLSDEEFYACLLEANTTLVNNYYHKKRAEALEQLKRLYLLRDAGFRGFRQT